MARKETRCLFQLAARLFLYVSSYRQDITYHGLCYTSHGVLVGTRSNSMVPPWGSMYLLKQLHIGIKYLYIVALHSYRKTTTSDKIYIILLIQ